MKEITEFFKQCPCFNGKKVREDFLSSETGSVAITHDGGERTVKKYASGDCLEQLCFKLMLRETFGGEAGRLFKALELWLTEGKQELPEMGDGYAPQYMEITEGPALVKTEVGAGIYEMKLKMVYYRKGVNNE